MIIALLVGFLSGWAISMPIGPVNAAAITRTLHYNYKHGFIVGLGAAVMDFLYCVGATQINEFLLQSPIVNLSFQVVGFALLLFLGLKSLRAQQLPNANEPTEKDIANESKAEQRVDKMHMKQGSYLASLSVGIVLYASNVAGVPEWIFISAFWRNQGVIASDISIAVIFAIGAGLGTAGWFFTLVRYFAKRSHSLKPKTIMLINRFAGIAMLAFGVYFGYQIIFKTNWTQVDKRLDEGIKKGIGGLTSLISRPAEDRWIIYPPHFSARDSDHPKAG